VTTAFRVGVFAIATIVAVFVVWNLLSNYSLTRHTYQIGIHFRNVAGLQEGSSVQISGVNIGLVDSIRLLPDQTATVICSINSDNTVYRESVFTVTSTLTGQTTLAITPPPNLATAVPLPRHVLPESEQPEGVVPPTIADLVSEGQKRIRSLDRTLAIVNAQLPGMVHHFNNVAAHTDSLVTHADRALSFMGVQLNTTVASVNNLLANFQSLVSTNGRNVTAMTTSLRAFMTKNGPRFALLVDDLSATADNLNKTMAAVTDVATDPRLKTNIMEATANLKDSSEKLKEVTSDIQSITGDPQVQEELKGAIRNLSGAIAKANAILGTVTTAQGASAGQSPSGESGGSHASPPRVHFGSLLSGLDLASAQVRETWPTNTSGGPASDLNLELLPRMPVHLTLGANDLGYHTTYNFLIDYRSSPRLQTGFGVLYSNLGAMAQYRALGPFGVDARLYDPRQPKLDLYGDIRLARRLELFYGERSLIGPASLRTPSAGFQLNL
jgi:ABC-type transporter Mla subunit MlaD